MTDFTTTAQNIQLASQALNKLTHSLETATGITTTSLTATSVVNVASGASINVAGAFSIALSGTKLMVSTIAGTKLFSIDGSGNVIALGTITPSSPP